MTLPQLLEQELLRRGSTGPTGPCQIKLADPNGNELEAELSALDSMSCGVIEVRLTIPALQNVRFDLIRQWAAALSQRITYLLEQIGPLEFDAQTGEALLRSTTPSQLPAGTLFYEFQLKSRSGNSVTLKRYQARAGQPGRTPVPMTLTHEVFVRLVQDLLDTVPVTP